MWRVLAALLVGSCVVVGCGGQSDHRQSTLPNGYHHYQAHAKGFSIDLAPGWRHESDDADGVTFAAPGVENLLSVRFARAEKDDLAAATAQMMTSLTGGGPLTYTGRSAATLAGLPAHRAGVDVADKGGTEHIEAVVTVQGQLAWAVALAGLRGAFDRAQADFNRMAGTFQFEGTQPSPLPRAALDAPAPDLPALQLHQVKGPIVLTFFASWCGPCRADLQLLQARARTAGGHFTLLAVDTQDDASKAAAFLKQLGVTAALRLDKSNQAYVSYQLRGVPATYFLDLGHVVRYAQLGPLDAHVLDQGLLAIGAGAA